MRAWVILLPVLVAGAAVADELSIALPELTGAYDNRWDIPPNGGASFRRTEIDLTAEIAHIDDLRVVLSGEWHGGVSTCHIDGQDVTRPYNPPLSVWLSYSAIGHAHSFCGDFDVPGGAFSAQEVALRFCSSGDPDPYDRLLDGPVEIWVATSQIWDCTPTIDASGTLTDVHLEITGSMPTTPSAWGTVKALYR